MELNKEDIKTLLSVLDQEMDLMRSDLDTEDKDLLRYLADLIEVRDKLKSL